MSGLASRLAEGEEEAWAELYDATTDALFGYITVISGDRDATSEILQETFVRLFRSRQRLPTVDDLKAYVFTVARNETSRRLKQQTRRPPPMSIDKQAGWYINEPVNEDLEVVQLTLAQLPHDQREIIHLKIHCDLTFVQISEVLELPQGTCASRYRRALSKIQSKIQEQIR